MRLIVIIGLLTLLGCASLDTENDKDICYQHAKDSALKQICNNGVVLIKRR